ncbi:vascular endothelial growth factor receptor kdr-like [Limosa lapponica baueri]|uniref:Vascular endothelial growth factor receptor kdr-like n=1 Tax=Limosa lapponica baueri TaxID=1758121 RepID=A0A2I0TDH9_LIMLA|nr:vascular endothelial growth factor receptor kdr-like [Limosa lapponica baueri]
MSTEACSPPITWHRDWHPYPRRTIDQSGTVYKVDSSLTIENVTMQDGGLYICKTFNVTRLEANVTVTVYDPIKYRLGIRDVRPKHAGNYTIVLSNAKYGLYKNLTMQLVVTGVWEDI